MKFTSGVHGKVTSVLLGGLIALVTVPGSVGAQEIQVPLEDENERAVDMSALKAQYASSRFRLFGEGDRAATGMRPTGTVEMLLTNTGIVDAADLDLDSQPDLFGCAICPRFTGFDYAPIYAAPRSEWVRFLGDVPSLLNATGGGYAVSRNFPTLSQRELLASDLQFGVLFSGAQSTEDGGCQDHSGLGPGGIQMGPGLTLLSASDCPPTWPVVNEVPTFGGPDPNPDKLLSFAGGLNPIPLETYLRSQADLGPDFNFDWWRVDGDDPDIDPAKRFGNFQTYGAYDDYNSSMIGRFGNVVPGGSGPPSDQGWPLGLRTEFTGFNFALPTVANTLFWRAIIINRTEDVYGVPLDYENVYVGYTDNRAHNGENQETSWYFEPWRGIIWAAEGGTGNPFCPGVTPPGAAFADCGNDDGFNAGASAILVLKSPIGDLRNVLLSCDPGENAARAATGSIPCPTSDFNDLSNPHAGDTITYNHYTMCPFGDVCGSETMLGPDRRHFGAIASNTADLLDGRDVGALSAGAQYAIFRNPNFPQQPTPFSFWVPTTWDYTANGPTPGGDTIWVPGSYGPPGVVIKGTTREDRFDACHVVWSDTMPVGELGNPAYNDQEGNVSFYGIGPFALPAGDTTAYVVAKIHQVDSTAIESEVNNAIDLYMNFYLSPEAPPKVNIVGVDVQVEDPALGNGRGEVTLFWDDASDDFIDPFLETFADNLAAAAAGTPLGIIRSLNPDLEARIRARARDNLEQIVIFKSCDGGSTFTANDTQGGILDCDADPAEDIQGTSLGAGWQAFATLPVDVNGEAANSFTDELVIPGQSYLYNISGQTRGASFAIINGVDTSSPPDGIIDETFPDSLNLAPSLLNPLATSTTEPNVVSVYVPATTQAGSRSAQILEVESTGVTTVPTEFQFTSQSPVEARYRAVAANQFVITEVRDADGDIENTTVQAFDLKDVETSPTATASLATDTVTVASANPNGVQIAGTPTSEVTVGDTTTITLDGLGFFLYRLDTSEPLFVSTELDGETTTPPTFFGRRPDGSFTGFPGFVVTVDNTLASDFNFSRYLSPTGAALPGAASPTVAFDNQNSINDLTFGVGTYEIAWEDLTFGRPAFELNEANPEVTQQQYTDALEARAVAQTAVTDSLAAALVSPFLTSPVTADDLVPLRMPFTIRNELFDRDVEVAVVPRASNEVLLGNLGPGDTVTVEAPEDAWIPGDNLFLIETVQTDSVGPSGGVVVDNNGKPIQISRRVVTFAPAVLSCLNFPRATCNPVIGTGSTDDWVSNAPDQALEFDYYVPVTLDVSLTFDTQRGLSGRDAIQAGMDITAQMDSIKAVPNPYIMFSQWQIATPQQNDSRLLFTHLPPAGKLRIFTTSGQFVQELTWGPDDLAGNGDLYWDMRTREGTDVAGGLYIFHVVANNPADDSRVTKVGKFAVIR